MVKVVLVISFSFVAVRWAHDAGIAASGANLRKGEICTVTPVSP